VHEWEKMEGFCSCTGRFTALLRNSCNTEEIEIRRLTACIRPFSTNRSPVCLTYIQIPSCQISDSEYCDTRCQHRRYFPSMLSSTIVGQSIRPLCIQVSAAVRACSFVNHPLPRNHSRGSAPFVNRNHQSNGGHDQMVACDLKPPYLLMFRSASNSSTAT
jgi:hypothetical protein